MQDKTSPWQEGGDVGRAAPGEQDGRSPLSETERNYEVGRGKPPVHTRFKKGQSGNPRGPGPKTSRHCWSRHSTRR